MKWIPRMGIKCFSCFGVLSLILSYPLKYTFILSFRPLFLQPPWQPFTCWLGLMCAHYSFVFGLTRLHPHLVGDGEDTHPSERGHAYMQTIVQFVCFFFLFVRNMLTISEQVSLNRLLGKKDSLKFRLVWVYKKYLATSRATYEKKTM